MGSSELTNKTSYDADVQSTYKKLANRKQFKYSPSADPAYKAYRDSYQREGQQAMKNTMAEAADLTGGYGNTYAQRLGQQQYGAYLEKLNDVMPELYSDAWQRYQSEGQALSDRLSAATGLANMEYGRMQDQQQRADQQEQLAYQRRQDSYKSLADIIGATGYVPSDDELQQSGMSREQAEALGYGFLLKNVELLPLLGVDLSRLSTAPGAQERMSIEDLKLSKNIPDYQLWLKMRGGKK